jgi:hypothetical protein
MATIIDGETTIVKEELDMELSDIHFQPSVSAFENQEEEEKTR